MQADLLAQLRDIHLPADPAWWPPAPGWWIVAVIALLALGYGIYRLSLRWRAYRPARQARALYLDVHAAYADRGITAETYLHRTNELLKRFAIFGAGDAAIKPEAGERWLQYLDDRAGSTLFSEGPGRWLGNDRFRRELDVDPEELHALLDRFFQRERAAFWSFK